MEDFWELLKIKPSRRNPIEGDIFVIQPLENVYFYGKVIKSNIESRNVFINSMWMINIYKNHTKSITVPNQCNEILSDLLIAPEIINKKGWTLGYFYTIGNIPVTKEEMSVDYGFEEFSVKQLITGEIQPIKFVNVEGIELDHEPKHHCIWGLSSYAVIGELVQKAIADNPKLIT